MKGNNLSAELAWFHVFKAMIDDGELAKMGPSAFATYCVIKFHANFSTGKAFPSVETICQKSGISERQVVNAEPGANVNVSSGGEGTKKTDTILQ